MPPSSWKQNAFRNSAIHKVPPPTFCFKSKGIAKQHHKPDKLPQSQLNLNIKRTDSKIKFAGPPSIVRNNPKRMDLSELQLPQP